MNPFKPLTPWQQHLARHPLADKMLAARKEMDDAPVPTKGRKVHFEDRDSDTRSEK